MAVKQESLVQAAIMASLEVYGDRNAVHTDVFAPYANQQGYAGGKYPGDIIGLLDGARILLLEVKELDYKAAVPVLKQFDLLQHLHYCWLEQCGVDVQYAYAARATMAYFAPLRRREWPYSTLHVTHVAPPGKLMDSMAGISAKRPAIEAHKNLLDWLLSPSSVSTASAAAHVMLLASSAADLTASVLIVHTRAGALIAMPAVGVRAALKKVLKKPLEDKDLQRRVEAVRDEIRAQKEEYEEKQKHLDQRIDALAHELERKSGGPSGPKPTKKARKEFRKQAREQILKGILSDMFPEAVSDPDSDPSNDPSSDPSNDPSSDPSSDPDNPSGTAGRAFPSTTRRKPGP
ncbi:hypothetical protein [Stenotrophomonas sp.]|uniref:hypothetical protein n=1 Tax=Stenotrophomonas sp. TaxID=69392 RepID=UPI0028AC1E74|nr:hypothetical protein [Stenotrophomonas sp.]